MRHYDRVLRSFSCQFLRIMKKQAIKKIEEVKCYSLGVGLVLLLYQSWFTLVRKIGRFRNETRLIREQF